MKMNKKQVASKATTRNLIEIARKHFSTHGYDKTSLESISSEANMTRGAVYHHYKNKQGLFHAVLQQVQKEVGDNVELRASTSSDSWEQLVLGCIGFVESAILPSNRRILLIDALNVVEWSEWRKMDNENSVALLIEQLDIVKKDSKLLDLDIVLVAHLISGALNELSLYLAESENYETKIISMHIDHLLRGFRKNGD